MKKYDTTEVAINEVIARTLKNAPDRKDGGGRKENPNKKLD